MTGDSNGMTKILVVDDHQLLCRRRDNADDCRPWTGTVMTVDPWSGPVKLPA
jgi:hypothetical protein